MKLGIPSLPPKWRKILCLIVAVITVAVTGLVIVLSNDAPEPELEHQVITARTVSVRSGDEQLPATVNVLIVEDTVTLESNCATWTAMLVNSRVTHGALFSNRCQDETDNQVVEFVTGLLETHPHLQVRQDGSIHLFPPVTITETGDGETVAERPDSFVVLRKTNQGQG